MHSWRVYKIASLFLTLLILCGCSLTTITTETQTIPVIQAGIQKDSPFTEAPLFPDEQAPSKQDSDQLVTELVAQRIKFAYVSLDSAVAHYLKGEPLIIVAGSVGADHEAWVLATQPGLIRSEPDAVRKAVQQFNAHSSQLACTPLPLSEESILAALQKRPDPDSKKINISWLIDRSFANAETTN